jgi:hypothetical protein
VTIERSDRDLRLYVEVRPEKLNKLGDVASHFVPCRIGKLPGEGEEYILTSGPMKSMRGVFTSDATGAIVGLGLAGRRYRHVRSTSHAEPARPIK